MKQPIFFTVAVFLIVAGCSGKKIKKDSVKVMTLNIRYDNPEDSTNAWHNRSHLIYDFIEEENPDIFGLQEVLWNQYEALDSVLDGYGSAGLGRDDGARGGEFNPVFYRKDKFDMARTITFWLSETPDSAGSKGWGASLPRIVTWIELVRKDNHEHFFFFNTHFAHDSDSARIKSSEILVNEIPKIAGSFPFIITGDMNMLPGSKGYEILTGTDASLSLFRDSYSVSAEKPEGPVYTYNGFNDSPGSGRIDYIFVKSGMKVWQHRTVARKNDVYISDHWPVVAIVSLEQE